MKAKDLTVGSKLFVVNKVEATIKEVNVLIVSYAKIRKGHAPSDYYFEKSGVDVSLSKHLTVQFAADANFAKLDYSTYFLNKEDAVVAYREALLDKIQKLEETQRESGRQAEEWKAILKTL